MKYDTKPIADLMDNAIHKLQKLIKRPTMTHSLTFNWNYRNKAWFTVFAEYAVYQGDIICTFEAVPGDMAATMVRLTNPNFEQEAHDECISQYHAYLTDAAIYKIDQP